MVAVGSCAPVRRLAVLLVIASLLFGGVAARSGSPPVSRAAEEAPTQTALPAEPTATEPLVTATAEASAVPTTTATLPVVDPPAAQATEPATPTPVPPEATASPTAAPVPTAVGTPGAPPVGSGRVEAAKETAPTLTLGVNAGHVGDRLRVAVAGFAPDKRVAVYFDGARKTTLVTDATGGAAGTIRVPTAVAGLHEIRATGGGISLTKKWRVRPVLAFSPTTIQAGNAVTVTLTGFAGNVVVKIRIYDIDGSTTVLSVWAATTDATGGLSQAFTTKRGLTAGRHKVIATDAAGNATSRTLTTYPARPRPPAPDDPARSQVYDHGSSGRREIALTFDAGAGRGDAEAILNILARYGVKASFGVTGQWAKANPDLVRRMVLEGHMLFNHTWSHRSFTGYSTTAWDAGIAGQAARWKELDDTAAAVARVAYGYDVRPYFRPPYGDYDGSVLRDAAADGYGATVMWSCDTLGWNGASVDQIVARCGPSAEAGDIILLHVANSKDAAALPRLIDLLRGRGYAFVTVERLLQP